MSSKSRSTMGGTDDLSSGLLLRDIEEISKALYLHKHPSKPFHSSSNHPPANLEPKSKFSIKDTLSYNKDKKPSLWNWKKPLKAITHIRHHRFNCCFFLHVHTIEGLHSSFNNLNLCVSWKRKGDILRSHPAPVYMGMAQFEETLMHRCTVYATRNGQQNLAKYEPKLFLLNTFVIGGPTLGNHWIDLTRLLPLSLDELDGEKRSSGKWTTSFKLTGKAEGAILNVSFGFSILDGNSYFVKVPEVEREGVQTVSSTQGSLYQSPSVDIAFLDQIVSNGGLEFGESVNLLYKKLDEEKNLEDSVKDRVKIEQKDSQRFDSSLIETIDVEEIFKDEDADLDENIECDSKLHVKEPAKEEQDLLLDINTHEQDNCVKLLSMDDDIAESIENDFLKTLSIEQSSDSEIGPPSPREQHLRRFEEEMMTQQREPFCADAFDFSFSDQAVEGKKRNFKIIEHSEMGSLMDEWGLDENDFQNSSDYKAIGFGSPVYFLSEKKA